MAKPFSKHQPVLLKEVLQYLDPKPGEFIIDGTLDGGGHATAILEKIVYGKGSQGTFLGVDLDKEMIARSNLNSQPNVILANGNYANLAAILKTKKLPLASGLLLDLGFSSEQLESSGRGFSFSDAARSETLLMTYDDSQTPVWGILKEIDERELADIIYQLGGERMSRRIARAIKEANHRSLIMTSGELADIVRKALPRSYERGRIDPATRTFQALRIYANHELENVQKVLDDLPKILKPGGRAVIISFHSLEDRIVKLAFQKLAKETNAELLTKKPISATREEIAANPRARSAKLRAITLS